MNDHIEDIKRKGHSHRNYTTDEFVTAYKNCKSVHEQSDVREQFRCLDDGRYYEMLDSAHNVFAHLDLEGQRQFAQNHPNLLVWIGVFGLIEDLNTFEDHSGIER